MDIQEYVFNESTYLYKGEVFTSKVEKDNWIFYHGTSSLMENDIDTQGLIWKKNEIGKEEVEQVVNIFKEMRWAGKHTGGYGILEAFTRGYDFGDGNEKTIYLAETSHRAMLYSIRDYSGGETQRAIRKCIEDLEKYLTDSSVRSDHEKNQLKHINNYERRYKSRPEEKMTKEEIEWKQKIKPELVKVDLDWLESKLKSIQHIKKICNNSISEYRYGLVYAVKLDKNNLEGITYHKAMGVQCNQVSNSSIIGKAVIPENFEWKIMGHPSWHSEIQMKRLTKGSKLSENLESK
jgi:hypothetical protein